MIQNKKDPNLPETDPDQQPDKEVLPEKSKRNKEGNPAEKNFIAEKSREEKTAKEKNLDTLFDANERNTNQKKEGNPAEKNFTPEEGDEKKNAEEPQLRKESEINTAWQNREADSQEYRGFEATTKRSHRNGKAWLQYEFESADQNL
jgi:hypothetical protein